MTKRASPKLALEARERAVRMVLDHEGGDDSQWTAVSSIAAEIGRTATTLRGWIQQAARDQGKRIYRPIMECPTAAMGKISYSMCVSVN